MDDTNDPKVKSHNAKLVEETNGMDTDCKSNTESETEAVKLNPAKLAAFSVSGENLAKHESDSDHKALTEKPSKSRFKVEFVDEPRRNSNVQTNGNTSSISAPNNSSSRIRQDSCRSNESETASPLLDSNTNDATNNFKTFGRNTMETLPHIDHYRNLLSATGAMKKRPTLLELLEYDKPELDGMLPNIENGNANTPAVDRGDHDTAIKGSKSTTAIKFGWITGVLVRCLLNIWGVMLFLRLSWVVGEAGIGLSIVIILLSAVVTVITTLSMSAICTNGEVKGGGAYFMISRSLGPEFGGAIGIVFSLANAVAVAMYVAGFSETIRDLLKDHGLTMIDDVNDVRIIGSITIVVLLAVALIGMEWEARAQIVLLVVLLLAMFNFIVGTFIPPSQSEEAKGFLGYDGSIFSTNFGSDFRKGEGFFSVFAIFFPAATGILAGANISGDLADAQRAIPKGTLLAILISTIVYILMAVMAGSCVLRDASGVISPEEAIANVTDLLHLVNTTSEQAQDMVMPNNLTVTTNDTVALEHCEIGECEYGLQNDMQVMQLVSGYGPLIIAGIISATLSSALASLVSAPKVFQAVCKDKIFPGIKFFAKGYGTGDDPRRAYMLAFIIALGFILIGNLNDIAPLISNFFLMSYALINFSCFYSSLSKSPGWRPAFKYYSKWIALMGAVLCLAIMFVINWWTALITIAVVMTLYGYVHHRKPDINWGSSTQAHVYRSALQSTIKLVTVNDHVKNYRPQLLVLTGFPGHRPALIDFASNITRSSSLLICGHVLTVDSSDSMKDPRRLRKIAQAWLHNRKIKGFYNVVSASTFKDGARGLLQCSGIGKLSPNTLLLGFKSNWSSCDPQETADYVEIISMAFDLNYGVSVMRLQEGLDFAHVSDVLSNTMIEDDEEVSNEISRNNSEAQDMNIEMSELNRTTQQQTTQPQLPKQPEKLVHAQSADINKDILKNINRFHQKQKKGSIDVWWMFDDGGLTLLVPYILSTKSNWQNCKLRVFTAGAKNGVLDRDRRHMATLLSKFRIDYSIITVLADASKKPSTQSQQQFQNLIQKHMLNEDEGETEETHKYKISSNMIKLNKDRIHRQIRLRELLIEHSKDAKLIVMTLPMPKKTLSCPALYMAMLETLTDGMPPMLLLRGNQESVLTYYS